MARRDSVLRFLLKYYLRRRHRRSMSADADPRAAQAILHRRMANALAGTRIAQLHDPRIWNDLDSYRRHLRTTGYDDYRALVAQALSADTCGGAFERGTTRAFGHSSSSRNFVPFTRAHVDNFRAFQLDVAAQLAIGHGCTQILSSPSLMIQGTLETALSPGGILTGYSSAVMIEQTPWLLKRRLLPSPSELRAPQVEARIASVRRALLEKRPRVLTGMPEFVVGVLRTLLGGPDVTLIREALRGIELYAWSGTPLGRYRAFFEEHLAVGCRMFDAVSSTEAPIGLQCSQTQAYRPALERTLLLFASPRDPADRRFAWELVEGAEYDVLLGSFAGFHGYKVGDRVRVVSARPLRFQLLSRAVDADATGDLLGASATDFCAYLDPTTRALRLIVESAAPLERAIVNAIVARLGASAATVRIVEAGRLAQAAVELSLRGIAKLPRLHSRPDVQALLESVT